MAKELSSGPMEPNSKVITKTTKNTVKALFFSLTVPNILESSKKVLFKAQVPTSGPTASSTKANG